jgi:hypothetical protein
MLNFSMTFVEIPTLTWIILVSVFGGLLSVSLAAAFALSLRDARSRVPGDFAACIQHRQQHRKYFSNLAAGFIPVFRIGKTGDMAALPWRPL